MTKKICYAPLEATDNVYTLFVEGDYGNDLFIMCLHLSTAQSYLEELADGRIIRKLETYSDRLGECIKYDIVDQVSLYDDFGLTQPEGYDNAERITMTAEVVQTTVASLVAAGYLIEDVKAELVDIEVTFE